MASQSPSRSPVRGRTRVRSHKAYSMSRSPTNDSRGRDMSRSRTPRRNGAYSRSPSRRLSRSPTPQPANTKIVVEKLTKNINEAHLREIYGAYGPIVSLDLPLNRQFMTNRGTAYVVFEYQEDAEAALASTHGGFLDGTAINVSVVAPREDHSESPPQSRRMHRQDQYYDRPHPRFDDRPYPGGRYRPPPQRGSPPRRPFPYRGAHDTYIPPPRSYNRSRTPPRSYDRSRSPPRRYSPELSDRHYRSRESPPRDYPPSRGGGRGRRSPSYSSYTYSERSRSSSRHRDSRR